MEKGTSIVTDKEFEKLLASAPTNLPREMRRAIKHRKKQLKELASQKSNLQHLRLIKPGPAVIHVARRKGK
jgi:hypothetical protein